MEIEAIKILKVEIIYPEEFGVALIRSTHFSDPKIELLEIYNDFDAWKRKIDKVKEKALKLRS